MRHTTFALAIASAAVLAGCGGGDSGPTLDRTLARGSLVASPPNLVPIPQADGTALAKLEPATFSQMLEASQPGLTQVTGTPKCAVSTYYMQYGTVGGKGEATLASGAIMVPSGSDPSCSGARPVVVVAHGTSVEKNNNMANLRDNKEATLAAATFAAQGFIVVAPNYAGYEASTLGYHPYLNAEQQANDLIDSLRAARKAFGTIGATDSGKLFLTGYSEGGYVAMAAQRAMQTTLASEFKVTALAGQSGPYALSLLSDVTFAGSPNAGGTVFIPLITTSWQNSYGGLYTTPADIYEAPYATGIDTLLPGLMTTTELFTSGKLPQAALFAKDSLPGPSAPQFGAFFGTGNLIKSSFRTAYLADAAANPCNVDPANPLNCTPANTFRKLAVKNDLRTYVPTVPVMLCGGHSDPTVFFASTQATAGYFSAKGLPAAALTVLDVDSAPTGPTDPYAAAKVGFGQSKTAAINAAVKAGIDPNVAVAGSYHGTLVYPFCNAAARGFFQGVLASGQ